MKVDLFQSMTSDEATDYLGEFLAFGQNRGLRLIEENLRFTTDLDFNIDSLAGILISLVPLLETVPRSPEPVVPEFIRNSEVYKNGLFEFDEHSNNLLLAAAYYLGETFVRAFPQLKWGTGDTDYREGNMPVVEGFKFSKQLAPILVVENLFRRVVGESGTAESITMAIGAWTSNVDRMPVTK